MLISSSRSACGENRRCHALSSRIHHGSNAEERQNGFMLAWVGAVVQTGVEWCQDGCLERGEEDVREWESDCVCTGGSGSHSGK
jgi:hypothetical protein